MAIFRGTGGQGDSTTDTTITVVTQKAADAAASASAASSSASSASGSATNAATSATNAATSETNAATSETNAATSETNASTSATNAETSKVAAQAAQTAAELAETNAETAETNAETAQVAAELAETNAETAETNAQASATTSTTKAGEASTSAATATTQAGIATTKASEASSSATDAQTAQTAAELAQTNAETAETAAETAQTAAETAQTAAETAETNAETAETNAETAETNASASATSASNSATAASTSETNAATSETNAATSETNAATSETNAANSASTASTNATLAFNARVAAELKLDQFDDRYLGSKTSDPTLDNDGDALLTGALYWNSTSNLLKIYTGSAWVRVISEVSQDTTPQLGGDLDLNSSDITGTGNINITGTLQTSSNAIIGGDLTVSGSTTTVNTEEINLADNNITLNSNHTGTPTQNAGLTVERGTSADKVFQWNESSDYWEVDDAFNVAGNITVTGTVDGRDVATDGTKLDGIETNATSDQTASEIRTLVESATDSNVFTDADHTKLNNIEASADVTDATNVTAAGALMDSEVTNLAQVKAFDSSDYATAAQGTTADAALPKTGGAMTGAITTNSTFDGRDVATDGTKLDGIEASADVTDTTNVTAAGALMDSEVTNLSQVKAFDSSDYATAAQGTTADAALPKAGGTMTGDITFNSGQTFDGRDVSVDGTRLDDNIIYNATNTNNVAGVWEATISDVTSYTDGLMIAFYPNKINGVSGGTTFEINSLGAKTVTRPDGNTTAITTHYNGTNLIFLRYVSADDYFIVHANYNTTDDYRIRYEHHVTANNSAGSGTAWFGYELLMEGIDGKFYPVTEGGSTGNTNAVSTAELRVGGVMLIYSDSTNRTANTNTGSYRLYEAVRLTTMEHWNNRDSGWATAYRPWYIVATINANGNFVLDNTSFTSFLTQDLPTSDDGKYYIHGGLMLDTYDDYRLQVNHPVYVYKNGAVREWGGYADNANLLDNLEATSFVRSDADDTATGQLTLTSSSTYPLIINGSDNGKIVLKGSTSPYIRFQESTADKAYIQWNGNTDSLHIANQQDSSLLRIKDAIEFSTDGTNFNSVWHGGNDGTGSGLDADLLDGNEATVFAKIKHTEFDLTPGTTTVDINTSLDNSVYKYVFVIADVNTSSGPYLPTLSVKRLSTAASWVGTYAYTNGSDGSIPTNTDLWSGLTYYSVPTDGIIIEIYRTTDRWIVDVSQGHGSAGFHFVRGYASNITRDYISSITLGTGNSYTWTKVQGHLLEYS